MVSIAALENLAQRQLILEGAHLRLEPLTLAHADALFAAGDDAAIWQWLADAAPASIDEMARWIETALARRSQGSDLPFVVIDLATRDVIGSTRYLAISPHDRSLEIGSTWYGTAYWRTAVNTECKYLLLAHAFEALGCIRVQFRTDLRNERSQRAIERIGAVREGTLRKVRIVKDTYQRSDVCYSIVDDEWPAVKARLQAMLRR